MAKYEVITVGGATLDIAFLSSDGRIIENRRGELKARLLAFAYGAKMEVERFYETCGGGAANAAVNLAGLGLKVGVLTSIGSDHNGHKVAANFRERGVRLDLLQSGSKHDTGFSFIIVNHHSRERLIFSYRGANHDLRLRQLDWRALNNSPYVYVSSLSGDYWLENLKVVFSSSKSQIVWNPGETQLAYGLDKLSSFLKNCYVFCVNREEAISLLKTSRKYQRASHQFLGDIRNLLTALKSFGPQIVLITDGPNGAYAYDGVKHYRQAIMKSQQRVDATGVGDAFNSTVLFGLIKYQSLSRALKLAAHNTASLVSEIGAQNGLLTERDLKKIKI